MLRSPESPGTVETSMSDHAARTSDARPALPTIAGGALAALALAAAVQAQTILYVDDDAPAGGDGTTWNKAYRDLQEALDTCRAEWIDGATQLEIRIAEGTYTPDGGTFDRAKFFDLAISVTSGMPLMLFLKGGFAGVGESNPDDRDVERHVSVMSGDLMHDDGPGGLNRLDNSYSVFRAWDCYNGVTLDGLTISGTSASPDGKRSGNVVENYSSGAPLRGCAFVDCVLSDNRCAAAPFTIRAGGLSLLRCRVLNNSAEGATRAGAIEYTSHYPVLAESCVFVGNHGGSGGALNTGSADTKIRACSFIANRAETDGGAVLCSGPYDSIENCLFVGNTAGHRGGALFVPTGWPTPLLNSTFASNSATMGGGAYVGNSEVVNCIFWDNRATGGGNELAATALFGSTYVTNCVVRGGIAGVFVPWSMLSWEPTNLDADPRFRNPGASPNWNNADYRLLGSSPCIDVGQDAIGLASEYDIAGGARRYNLRPGFYDMDIGCYELQPSTCTADFDENGWINGTDFDSFVSALSVGSAFADANLDGVANSADFDLFLARFEEGC